MNNMATLGKPIGFVGSKSPDTSTFQQVKLAVMEMFSLI